MRYLLIDHARPLSRRTVKVDTAKFDLASEDGGTVTLQEVDGLLQRLAHAHPRSPSIVEIKVFEGLPVEDSANHPQAAPRTAARN